MRAAHDDAREQGRRRGARVLSPFSRAGATLRAPMNLTRLQTFVAVVRSGTFAGAADELAFTPSAVSQQMSKLEAELGTALLVRDGRGVAGHRGRIELTDAGRRLHERALAIATAVREAQAGLDALRSGRPDRLRLGSFPAATGGV